jgi:glutamyl-tRNA reductase
MFFIDLGDRRNFDAQINSLDNVYLYNIDDLQAVANENLQERSNEAEKAEAIVLEEVGNFTRWVDSLDQVPTITALRQRFEDIRRKEMEKSLGGGLKDLTEPQREALEDMTAAMINKMLHGPISHLKRSSKDDEEEGLSYLAALKKLFDLEQK